MSILIKGMKMPKDCIKCPFCLLADGHWKCLADGSFADFGGTCRPPKCPLIEVPTPHGRLKDADELLRHKGDAYDSEGHLLYAVGTGSIIAAPTIIEAEKGANNENL